MGRGQSPISALMRSLHFFWVNKKNNARLKGQSSLDINMITLANIGNWHWQLALANTLSNGRNVQIRFQIYLAEIGHFVLKS